MLGKFKKKSYSHIFWARFLCFLFNDDNNNNKLHTIKGWVPELDEDGKPIKSDSKFALSATAFVVAAGAIALRIGGRAALVSAVGLDFIADNPEMQSQMNQVLSYAENMDVLLKGAAFCFAWTLVKVLCFDAGGIVLALSSGILFGGVFQGAIISAFGATVGSSVAFTMAKLDTPVRKKALEIVDENPSLRGIERVVAEDGLKAILTLRLAPILPIPLGMYNYVYGVTNVPFLDFAGGIFLGSLKPYLLDSYLGVFGKTIVDGTANDETGIQDILLLAALGFSVLIGVFASQLAGETWDAVLEEEANEKKKAAMENGEEDDEEKKDGLVRTFFGIDVPEWLIGFQISLKQADVRMTDLFIGEFDAKAWNYTSSQGDNPVPPTLNPAFNANSPEIAGAYKGVDIGASICDGLVLTPLLFNRYQSVADPLFDEEAFRKDLAEDRKMLVGSLNAIAASGVEGVAVDEDKNNMKNESPIVSLEVTRGELLNRLQIIRDETKSRLNELENKK